MAKAKWKIKENDSVVCLWQKYGNIVTKMVWYLGNAQYSKYGMVFGESSVFYQYFMICTFSIHTDVGTLLTDIFHFLLFRLLLMLLFSSEKLLPDSEIATLRC